MRRWGADFDPDRLADLETAMWKAYYRRQPARLFGLPRAGDPRAGPRLVAAGARGEPVPDEGRGAVRPARPATTTGSRPTSRAAIGSSGLPPSVDAEEVARRELRWWVVRREIGLAAGAAAGEAITRLYAAIYDLPEPVVAEAGRLRGEAAEVRDRGATADPDGPQGAGRSYWPEVARLLRASYRDLKSAVAPPG